MSQIFKLMFIVTIFFTSTVSAADVSSGTKILKITGDTNFGNLTTGQSLTKIITLHNYGTSPLTIRKIYLHEDISMHYSFTDINACVGNDIAPSDTCDVAVTYAPSSTPPARHAYSGLIYFASNKTSGMQEKYLRGSFNTTTVPTGTRILKIMGDTHFGELNAGQSLTKTITLYNAGTSPLKIKKIYLHEDISMHYSFSDANACMGNDIAPGGTCDVDVTYAPSSTPPARHAYSGLIYFASNKTSGLQDKYLQGSFGSGTVSVGNTAPVANAGQDVTVDESTQVEVDASGSSDADGDTLTYQWSILSVPNGSGAVLSDASLVNPTFITDVIGDYVLQLIVNDGQTDSTPDTVTITANVIRDFVLNVCDVWSVTSSGGASGTTDVWDISQIPPGSSFDFEFQAFNIPDKFKVKYNDIVELDTSWRGSRLPDTGEPLEGPGRFDEYGLFIKSAGVDTMTIQVTGEQAGTGWNYRVRCTDNSAGS